MNPIAEYFDHILTYPLSQKQWEHYTKCRNSELVNIILLSDLPIDLKPIINNIFEKCTIMPKQCYKNSADFVINAHLYESELNIYYIEGFVSDDTIGFVFDHAFLKIVHGDKTYYIDPTLEIFSDVSRYTYAATFSYAYTEVLDLLLEHETYGPFYE